MEATHQVFKVSKSTIRKWEKQLKETGDLGKKELHRSFRKIDPEKLKAYVAEHPDAYQSEMAEAFGCSESGHRYMPVSRIWVWAAGPAGVWTNSWPKVLAQMLFVAQNAGYRLLSLPPYSPELNPIEQFWAWLKRLLRKILPSPPPLDNALSMAFQLW